LVWHYHDDLVDAPAVPVTLDVAVPPGFRANALVTHARVDETHGDAFTAWVAQGSPEAPTAVQLAALEEAMLPALLAREQVTPVRSGAVRLAFELPRFGVSLLTLVPQSESQRAASPSEASCSYRLTTPAQKSLPALWAFLLAFAQRRRSRRRAADGAQERSPSMQQEPSQ